MSGYGSGPAYQNYMDTFRRGRPVGEPVPGGAGPGVVKAATMAAGDGLHHHHGGPVIDERGPDFRVTGVAPRAASRSPARVRARSSSRGAANARRPAFWFRTRSPDYRDRDDMVANIMAGETSYRKVIPTASGAGVAVSTSPEERAMLRERRHHHHPHLTEPGMGTEPIGAERPIGYSWYQRWNNFLNAFRSPERRRTVVPVVDEYGNAVGSTTARATDVAAANSWWGGWGGWGGWGYGGRGLVSPYNFNSFGDMLAYGLRFIGFWRLADFADNLAMGPWYFMRTPVLILFALILMCLLYYLALMLEGVIYVVRVVTSPATVLTRLAFGSRSYGDGYREGGV